MPAALVTGGAKRIGRAFALALADRGYDIAIHYNHSASDAEELKREIAERNKRAEIFRADLSSSADTARLIPEIKSANLDLTLVINNASLFKDVPLIETTDELFDENMNVHVRAPLAITRDFAKHFGKGQIINIVDTFVNKNVTNYFAYHLSKKALLNLTMMSAQALAPNIRVNAIAPGSSAEPIDSEGGYMEERAKQVPLKMAGSPDYLIQAMNYLIDAPFVTGECLWVDGGVHVQL